MSDAEEVKIFIPQIHPEIAQMRERGEFVFSLIELGRQAYEPDYFVTQEWAEKIKNAINQGIFEVTGGMQTIPEDLIHLEPSTEVILRLAKIDQLVTAETSLSVINAVVERQKKGQFLFSEVVAILSKVSGGSYDHICQEAMSAFTEGRLRFYSDGSPVSALGVTLPIYGEYTTPDEVNRWLEVWGAQYRFPKNQGTVSIQAASNQTPTPVSTSNSRVSTKVWTDQRKAEAAAYREKYGTKKTAEHYNVTPALIRKHLPRNQPKPKEFNSFIHKSR